MMAQPTTLCPLVDLQPVATCVPQDLQMKADSADAQTYENIRIGR